MVKKKVIARVQFITNPTASYCAEAQIRDAIAGGCTWVQYRDKRGVPPEGSPLRPFGYMGPEASPMLKALCKLCHEKGVTFIIDDDVRSARIVGADGVHLGQHDMPVDIARSLLRKRDIIGATANTFQQVRFAAELGADYIGCGPFRYTSTKSNLAPLLGLEGIAAIKHDMLQAGINLPLIAIGGITAHDIPSLVSAGADGIAVSGAVTRARNPVEAMAEIIEKIQNQ